MTLITRIADKAGTFGSIVPALGLGFLQDYKGLFISRLMPLFAALARHYLRLTNHAPCSQCKNLTFIGDYACTGR